MEFDDKNKIDILLSLLNERYNVSHKIRERSLRFTLWILGFAIAFVWILINGTFFTISQKIILTFLVVVFGIISFWFVRSLEKGFNKNREVMIDIEKALGCYDEGFYVGSKALYPDTYREKKKKSRFSHFRSIYLLIIPVVLLIICLVWVAPVKHEEKTKERQENKKAEMIYKSQTARFYKKFEPGGYHG